jgi:DNA-binding Lrp family transcriptional regulator
MLGFQESSKSMGKSSENELYEETLKLWSHYSKRIKDFFGLNTEGSPSGISLVRNDDSRQNAFGAWLEYNILHISNQVAEGVIPLKAVVARASMKSALSKADLCSECIDDLSTEFARQTLEGLQEKKWVLQWSSQSPRRTLGTILVYNPSVSFPSLHRMVGARGLRSLILEISTMPKYGLGLDIQEYLTFLRARFLRFSVRLSSTELGIVNALMHHGGCSYQSIGVQMGISAEWVSRRISSLRRRSLLRRYDRVPFSRVGIRMFYLLLAAEEDPESLLSLLAPCPFLYAYRKILAGRWDALAILAIPDNDTSIRSLLRFLHLMEKWSYETSLIEVVSSGTVNCFDYYDSRDGLWAIPWELLGIQIRKVYNDELGSAFPRVDYPASRTEIHLDRLDMQIFDHIRHGSSSIAKVRTALHIGQQRAAGKLKRMREAGLILSTWEIHNIGLNESAIAVTDDKRTAESITAWTQRFPRSIVSFDESRKLCLVTQLPSGGSFGMARALSSLSGRVTVEMLGMKIYGAWGFPTNLWDANGQRWRAPEDGLREWFEKMNA